MAAYSVQHAVAIGDAPANLLLTARSSNHLCGQVVSVNCGGSTVDAVVASICNKNAYNCGVDLIRKSWDLATGNKPPGIKQCTMALADSLPMASSEAQCFFPPQRRVRQSLLCQRGFVQHRWQAARVRNSE